MAATLAFFLAAISNRWLDDQKVLTDAVPTADKMGSETGKNGFRRESERSLSSTDERRMMGGTSAGTAYDPDQGGGGVDE